ncbi:helix-turn-helix domain-containing protein [Pantoea sp. GD03673]|uniref:helix-turn-helix domain-containing protein n=1 Tax=Pantoea sp. GD03673 TaxID=2975364 RepID=UPI002448AF43|nr:helix-turn-helix domain-containing protein [Pantoea sp. GD03673]MDH2068887.1 helix-turn-helix domain-containing protein [Pantoea sp. GD03673]
MSSINRFKEHRLARAWSQEQLAEMAGLSTRTVQRIENGERPGLETLSALAAVFEVNVADLTGPQNGEDQALDQRIVDARRRIAGEARFYRSLITAVMVCGLLFILNHMTAPDNRWSLWVAAIWGTLLAVRAMRTFVFHGLTQRWQQKRLQKMLRR